MLKMRIIEIVSDLLVAREYSGNEGVGGVSDFLVTNYMC